MHMSSKNNDVSGGIFKKVSVTGERHIALLKNKVIPFL